MRMRINKKNIKWTLLLSYILIYILMRPFLISYVSKYCKYLFLVLVLIVVLLSITSKKCINLIGSKELLLLSLLYIFIIANALWYGGNELVTKALSAYILYTFPIIALPFISNKIKWLNIFKCLSIFGVIDAGISIIEFVTRQRMFPKAGIEGGINLVTSAGTNIVRTYGLQGSFFILSDILCLCAFSSWYMYRIQKKYIYLLFWILISLGILSTGSRGYYVSYFIGMFIMYMCEGVVDHSRRKMTSSKLLVYVLILLSGLIMTYIIFFSSMVTGIENIDVVIKRMRMIIDWKGDSANLNRLRIWRWAISYWKESVITGHGACCTDLSYSGYISVTESGVLKRLVELGIIGTVLQYLTMITPIAHGIKKIRSNKSNPTVLVAIGVLAAYFVEDCVLQRYTSPEYTMILWFSIAYIAYAKNKTQKE